MPRKLARTYNTDNVNDINILVTALQTQVANHKEAFASYMAEIAANADGKVNMTKFGMQIVFSTLCTEAALLDRLFPDEDGATTIPLDISPAQSLDLLKLIKEHHIPALSASEGMVTQLWDNGEISCQTIADLLWNHSNVCPQEQGFEGLKITSELWPLQRGEHGYMLCTKEAAYEIRAAMIEMVINNLLS